MGLLEKVAQGEAVVHADSSDPDIVIEVKFGIHKAKSQNRMFWTQIDSDTLCVKVHVEEFCVECPITPAGKFSPETSCPTPAMVSLSSAVENSSGCTWFEIRCNFCSKICIGTPCCEIEQAVTPNNTRRPRIVENQRSFDSTR